MTGCPTCDWFSPWTQINEMANWYQTKCNKTGTTYWGGKIWVDLIRATWTSDHAANQYWYKQLVDSCTILGLDCGIYTSK